jgi:hypothetical protein
MLERDPFFPRIGEPTQETEFSKLFWFFYAQIWDASLPYEQLIQISWFSIDSGGFRSGIPSCTRSNV